MIVTKKMQNGAPHIIQGDIKSLKNVTDTNSSISVTIFTLEIDIKTLTKKHYVTRSISRLSLSLSKAANLFKKSGFVTKLLLLISTFQRIYNL